MAEEGSAPKFTRRRTGGLSSVASSRFSNCVPKTSVNKNII